MTSTVEGTELFIVAAACNFGTFADWQGSATAAAYALDIIRKRSSALPETIRNVCEATFDLLLKQIR